MTKKSRTDSMSDRMDDSIRFVARHYRKDAFDGSNALWRKYVRRSVWRRWGVAAAVAGGVLVVSAAGVLIGRHLSPSAEPVVSDTIAASPEIPAQVVAEPVSMRLVFKDAPLAEVCDEIERTYNVRLADIPETSETLTLEYEGTAADLVSVINDILGTNIRIDE